MKQSLFSIIRLKQALISLAVGSVVFLSTFSMVVLVADEKKTEEKTTEAEALPFYNSAEFTPNWIKPYSKELEDFHRIPSFSFINQDGKKITDRSFQDKIYVAGFFFSTCPGICPIIRSKLVKVQEAFIDDPKVSILQHSIRPTTDTPEVLQKYAKENGIKSGKWNLVTGDKDTIYKLAKSAYFASEDLGNIQNTDDFLHTESLLLIDQNRQIRGIYNGMNSSSIAYLITDIKALKKEMETPMDCH